MSDTKGSGSASTMGASAISAPELKGAKLSVPCFTHKPETHAQIKTLARVGLKKVATKFGFTSVEAAVVTFPENASDLDVVRNNVKNGTLAASAKMALLEYNLCNPNKTPTFNDEFFSQMPLNFFFLFHNTPECDSVELKSTNVVNLKSSGAIKDEHVNACFTYLSINKGT